jgi:hypothetical protein
MGNNVVVGGGDAGIGSSRHSGGWRTAIAATFSDSWRDKLAFIHPPA